MIVDAKKNALCYKGISANLDMALEHIMKNDLSTLQPGKYTVKEGEVFFSVVEVETQREGEALFEAHRNYLDIHCPISGEEIILIGDIGGLGEETPYSEEADCAFYRGAGRQRIAIGGDDFLVCFPADIHAPAIAVAVPGTLKKAIFKVKI